MDYNNTYTLWSLKVGDLVLKGIRVISVQIIPEYCYTFTMYSLFRWHIKRHPTSRWNLRIKYDRGPLTLTRTAVVTFSSKNRADLEMHYISNILLPNLKAAKKNPNRRQKYPPLKLV